MKTAFYTNLSKTDYAFGKRSILFYLLIFALSSCKKELYTGDKDNLAAAQNTGVKIASTSYSNFLTKIDISKLGLLSAPLRIAGKPEALRIQENNGDSF